MTNRRAERGLGGREPGIPAKGYDIIVGSLVVPLGHPFVGARRAALSPAKLARGQRGGSAGPVACCDVLLWGGSGESESDNAGAKSSILNVIPRAVRVL